MRIIHLESSPGWGGQEIRIWREALSFTEKGYQLFFGCGRNSPLARKAQSQSFPTLEVSFRKSAIFPTFFSLFRFIKRHKIDLIITHSSMDSWLGGIIGKILSIPIIRTRHLSTKVKGGLNSYLLYNLLADRIVTTCSEIISPLSKQSRKKREHFQCIPTGIDTNVKIDKKAGDLFREEYDIGKEELLVGMVCFMRSWKGVDDFIEAAYLTRDAPSIRWMIVGEGHSKKYRDRVQKLGLDRFIFTGHLDNPLKAIQAMDIFSLLSTAHEGISQSSLQAAFLEKPLITTKTGGLKEVCIDRKTGILVATHSPSQVVEAVRLLQDKKVRIEFGKAAKELVLQKFTFEQTIAAMESIFSAVAK